MSTRNVLCDCRDDQRLEELEHKERAHDDYLAGLAEVEKRATEIEARAFLEPSGRNWAFSEGFNHALRTMSTAIVNAAQGRMDRES